MSPFRVSASTSALRPSGKLRLMPPLMVVNSSELSQLGLPIWALIEPLTVLARA
jgi:hypothetical protein